MPSPTVLFTALPLHSFTWVSAAHREAATQDLHQVGVGAVGRQAMLLLQPLIPKKWNEPAKIGTLQELWGSLSMQGISPTHL